MLSVVCVFKGNNVSHKDLIIDYSHQISKFFKIFSLNLKTRFIPTFQNSWIFTSLPVVDQIIRSLPIRSPEEKHIDLYLGGRCFSTGLWRGHKFMTSSLICTTVKCSITCNSLSKRKSHLFRKSQDCNGMS